MARINFRVKLDLCNFYNDVRRFSWIFIDGTKMMQISHVKKHITKLFNIKEPFHLLLNQTEYLPPDEDVRILEENETVVVLPGLGFEKDLEVSSNSIVTPEVLNIYSHAERLNSIVHETELQATNTVIPKHDRVAAILQVTQKDASDRAEPDVSTTDMSFHSVVEDNEESSANDSKATDNTVTEDFSISNNNISKRKRTRTRRRKKETLDIKEVKETFNQKKNITEKPKVINSFTISSGKHIRFSNTENENNIARNIMNEQTPTVSYSNNNPYSKDLTNLLSLSQNSTPITFVNKRIKQEVKVERVSDEETSIPETISKNVNGYVPGETMLTSKELQAYPVMTTNPQVKNIIAFKMLKIGADYTPQVSDFIVGEVVSYCPKSSLYTFYILQGISEVQVPVGKFTLMEDEEESVVNDTITINQAQIMEPRLITSDSKRSATLDRL